MRLIDKLRNLLAMAVADGSLSEREIHFLSDRVLKWGITEHEFTEAVEFALSHRGQLTLPSDREAGLDLLREMVQMMAADGQLSESEKRMFATAAAYLNVSQSDIDQLIDGLIEDRKDPDQE